MASEDHTSEFNVRGLVVIRDGCTKAQCDTCLSELLKGLDIMMQLPGPMNEQNPKRHFLKVPVSKSEAVPKEFSHRRDFSMSHSKNTHALLKTIIADSPAGGVLKDVLGEDGELIEMNAIISEPGSKCQNVHADGDFHASAPRILTMFLALHDIVDESLGPTRFWPETHSPECYADKKWVQPTEERVEERGDYSWYKLNAGDAVIMDQCTWHAGGPNTSDRKRTLLSMTFMQGSGNKNSKCYQLNDFLS